MDLLPPWNGHSHLLFKLSKKTLAVAIQCLTWQILWSNQIEKFFLAFRFFDNEQLSYFREAEIKTSRKNRTRCLIRECIGQEALVYIDRRQSSSSCVSFPVTWKLKPKSRQPIKKIRSSDLFLAGSYLKSVGPKSHQCNRKTRSTIGNLKGNTIIDLILTKTDQHRPILAIHIIVSYEMQVSIFHRQIPRNVLILSHKNHRRHKII